MMVVAYTVYTNVIHNTIIIGQTFGFIDLILTPIPIVLFIALVIIIISIIVSIISFFLNLIRESICWLIKSNEIIEKLQYLSSKLSSEMDEVRKTLSQISSEQREMRKEFQDRLYDLSEIKITEIKERLMNISDDLHKIIYKLKK
jgi:Mg2+/Co2+ transporter CorB